jgi:hypothetical protein
MEDAEIRYRNFEGREGQYNREGDRNFCLMLDEAVAKQMETDGWNIHWTKPREEGDIPRPYTQISVSWKGRPPLVVMITSKGRTTLGEDMVELLDSIDIKTVDLIVRPYTWAVGGRGGVKGYLKSMYVVVDEDPLVFKWAHVEEVGSGPRALSAREDIIDGLVIDDPLAITGSPEWTNS